MKKVLSIILVIALVVVFAVSAFMVGRYFVNSKKSSNSYEELAEMVSKPKETTEAASKPAEDSSETAPTLDASGSRLELPHHDILPDYEEIYARNGDTVGWIKIEGTKVDYPVMQTKEHPNYYLKRDFYGNASDWGSIYIREECDVNKPSDNVTIYGHNMIDGSMFGEVGKYADKKFWEEHKLIYFDTLKEYHVYEIFGVFKTSANEGEGFAYHQMEDAANEAEFNEFVSTVKKLSFYDTGITPKYGDKLICLSTCEYTLDNGRFVVAARRIS